MGVRTIRVGDDDFKSYRDQGSYLVDKSLLIKEVIDGSKVLLLPRPRRFGKSLNLSMLYYFFEKSEDDRSYLFKDLKVARYPDAMEHQGRYPTIRISLKDVRGATWAEAREIIVRLVSELCRSFASLRRILITDLQKADYQALLDGNAGDAVLKASLGNLISLLFEFHRIPVVVLIDEYDAPVIEAYRKGYYDDMIDFMRAWLGTGLKHEEGRSIFRAMVTGVLRVTRESIFSDLNNLDVWSSLTSGPFADKFGFTEEEVLGLLASFDMSGRMEEVREWYNGYNFGGHVIYNPWSVVNYVNRYPAPAGPYWLNTSSNVLVFEELANGGLPLKRDLEKLLAGEELRHPIHENVVFQDIGKRLENIWSLLCFSGYLRAEDPRPNPLNKTDLRYRLSIPNLEVGMAYEQFINSWHSELKFGATEELLQALTRCDLPHFERLLGDLVLGLVSYHDTARYPEAAYHAFLLGLLANLRSVYEIRSNPESGYGRADIIMRPKTREYPLAFAIEFKTVDRDSGMDAALDEALAQIEERHYEASLLEAGVAPENIRRLAIVVRGKEVRVRRKAEG